MKTQAHKFLTCGLAAADTRLHADTRTEKLQTVRPRCQRLRKLLFLRASLPSKGIDSSDLVQIKAEGVADEALHAYTTLTVVTMMQNR